MAADHLGLRRYLRSELQTVSLRFQLLGDAHILLGMHQNDVDFRREQASQGHRGRQRNGHAERGDMDLMATRFVGCEVDGQEGQPREREE